MTSVEGISNIQHLTVNTHYMLTSYYYAYYILPGRVPITATKAENWTTLFQQARKP